MSSGVFKPYAWVPTKKDWFYDMEADEFSLDDKRTFTDGEGDMIHYSSNHFPTSVASTLKCQIIMCIDSVFGYIIGLTRH